MDSFERSICQTITSAAGPAFERPVPPAGHGEAALLGPCDLGLLRFHSEPWCPQQALHLVSREV